MTPVSGTPRSRWKALIAATSSRRVAAVDRPGVVAELGQGLLQLGHARRERVEPATETLAQRGVRRLVELAGFRQAEIPLQSGDRGRRGLVVDAGDVTLEVPERLERELELGDEHRRVEELLLALGDEVDVSGRDWLEHAVDDRRRRDAGRRDVARLVEGDPSRRAVVVDVLAGGEQLDAVGERRAGPALGGDRRQLLPHGGGLRRAGGNGGERQADRRSRTSAARTTPGPAMPPPDRDGPSAPGRRWCRSRSVRRPGSGRSGRSARRAAGRAGRRARRSDRPGSRR